MAAADTDADVDVAAGDPAKEDTIMEAVVADTIITCGTAEAMAVDMAEEDTAVGNSEM